MKLKEYMDQVTDGWEFTCWDNVIDSEFYLYKKDADDEPDLDFPNVEKLMDYLKENLEIKEIHTDGVVVGLYELLDHPAIIEYAKEHFYEASQYSSDEDIVMLLFDDMNKNISNGFENFSGKMLEAFLLAYPEEKEIEQVTVADNLRKVYILTCTHETRHGVDAYSSVHASRNEALAHIETVKVECDYEEDEAGEYFDYDITISALDISKLQPVNELSVSKEMNTDEAKDNKISVGTPLGDIVVQIKTDSEYPGVFIDLKGDKVNDTFEVGTVMLGTVEYDPLKKAVQTLVYGDAEREEPTQVVVHENVEKNIETEVYRLLDNAVIHELELDVESPDYKKALSLLKDLTLCEFPELYDCLFEDSSSDLFFKDQNGDFGVYYYNPDSNSEGQIVNGSFEESDLLRFLNGDEVSEVIEPYTQYLSDIDTYHFFDTAFHLIALKENGHFLGTDIAAVCKNFLKSKEIGSKSLDEKINVIRSESADFTINNNAADHFNEVESNKTIKNIERNSER